MTTPTVGPRGDGADPSATTALVPGPNEPAIIVEPHHSDPALADPNDPRTDGAPVDPRQVKALQRNALWLLISSGGSAALGLIYWAVAGQFYSVEQFGRDGAIITAMLGVSGVGQLNLPAAMLRFLPGIVTRRVRVVIAAMTSAVIASVLVAALALALLGGRIEGLHEAMGRTEMMVAFVFGAALWSLFVLQDALLIAVGQARWVPVKNLGNAVLKIGLAFGLVGALGGFGIFASWWIALLVVSLPLIPLIVRFTRTADTTGTQASKVLAGLDRRGLARLLGLDYAATMIGQSFPQFIPSIVLATAGVAGSASFLVPFTTVLAIDMLSFALLQSFTAEAARDESRLAHLGAATAVRIFAMVSLAVLVCLLGASLLLMPFGVGGGADGADVLRLLVLGCFGRAMVNLFESICRMQGRTGVILILQLLTCLTVLTATWIGGTTDGATGVATGWVLAYTAVGVVCAFPVLKTLAPAWRKERA